MSIGRVQAGTGAANSANPAVILGATPTDGNFLVAGVANNGGGAQTVAGAWSQLTPLLNSDRGALYWKPCGAGESATQQPCTIVANQWGCIMREYSGVLLVLPVDVENAQAQAVALMVSPGVDPLDGVEVLIVGFAMKSAVVTWSADRVNSSTTGINVAGGPVGTSTSARMWDLLEAATAAGTYTADVTASSAQSGSAHIAIFKAAAVATKAPPPFQKQQRLVTRRVYV